MPEIYRVIITDRASKDLLELATFIARDSPQSGEAVAQTIVEGIDSLATMPERFRRVGRSRKRESTVHAMVVYPFIVYYRIDEGPKAVLVLHILHGSRRQPKRFG